MGGEGRVGSQRELTSLGIKSDHSLPASGKGLSNPLQQMKDDFPSASEFFRDSSPGSSNSSHSEVSLILLSKVFHACLAPSRISGAVLNVNVIVQFCLYIISY